MNGWNLLYSTALKVIHERKICGEIWIKTHGFLILGSSSRILFSCEKGLTFGPVRYRNLQALFKESRALKTVKNKNVKMKMLGLQVEG